MQACPYHVVAVTAACLACILGSLAVWWRAGESRSWALPAAVAATGVALVAFVLHLAFGHAPATHAGLAVAPDLADDIALVLTAAVIAAAILLLALLRR